MTVMSTDRLTDEERRDYVKLHITKTWNAWRQHRTEPSAMIDMLADVFFDIHERFTSQPTAAGMEDVAQYKLISDGEGRWAAMSDDDECPIFESVGDAIEHMIWLHEGTFSMEFQNVRTLRTPPPGESHHPAPVERERLKKTINDVFLRWPKSIELEAECVIREALEIAIAPLLSSNAGSDARSRYQRLQAARAEVHRLEQEIIGGSYGGVDVAPPSSTAPRDAEK